MKPFIREHIFTPIALIAIVALYAIANSLDDDDSDLAKVIHNLTHSDKR